MFAIFDIAGAGMSAQSIRLNTTASNMANAESAASSPESAYKAKHPVFAQVMNALNEDSFIDESNVSVQVMGIVESDAPTRMKYEPNNPMSDDNGYIHLPNVNIVEEMANMISASRAYQNNAQMLNTAKQLMQRTLQMGQ